MSDPIDYYDVQAAIRDARCEISTEISRAVGHMRDDLHVSLSDLRAGLADLAEEVRMIAVANARDEFGPAPAPQSLRA